MNKSSNGRLKTKYFSNKAEALLNRHRKAIQKQAEIMLHHSNADIARMSTDDIQKLLFEFQVHQIELKMQNEELNRAHHELAASRDNYAQLYDSSPVAYVTLNEAGIIKNANTAATALLGCSKKELINKRLEEFIHISDQDTYYLFIHNLLAQKTGQVLNVKIRDISDSPTHPECKHIQYSADFTETTRSHGLTYVECRAKIVHDDKNALQICLTINDITDRKQAQETVACLNEKLEEKIRRQTSELTESNLCLMKKVEELRHSKHQLLEREAKLNSIFNASVEGIITIDMSNIIVSANAAVETIFGYKPEQLVGCSINKLIPSSPKTMNDCSLPGTGRSINQIQEVEGLHKNGSMVPLDLSVAEFSIDNAHYFANI
ncbi:MAG: PAS domain-containing protein, partial [Methylobacter sp.]